MSMVDVMIIGSLKEFLESVEIHDKNIHCNDPILTLSTEQKTMYITCEDKTSPHIMPIAMRESIKGIVTCRCLFAEQKGINIQKVSVLLAPNKEISKMYIDDPEFALMYIVGECDDFLIVTKYDQELLAKSLTKISDESKTRYFSYRDFFVPLLLMNVPIIFNFISDQELCNMELWNTLIDDDERDLKTIKERLAVIHITDRICRWNGMKISDTVYCSTMMDKRMIRIVANE